jgi:hypothetical protein
MLNRLNEIDASAIQELARIKQEQTEVEGYMAKAGELKGKVDALVYERVLEDYRCRYAALEEKARPFKDGAREQYRKLRALHEDIASDCEEARLSREELELRHSVGELDEAPFKEKLREIDNILKRHEAELTEVDQLAMRFVEVFRSREELEDEVDSRPTGPSEHSSQVTGPLPANRSSKKRDKTAEPLSVDSLDETVIVPSEMLRSARPEKKPKQKPRAKSSKSDFDNTLIVPDAMFVAQKKDKSPVEYRLGALSYIGRNEENHIRLQARGVSRKHAMVMAGPEGFILRDLESKCGTFVNDKRIEECSLNNGDRIRIGEVQLVFKHS